MRYGLKLREVAQCELAGFAGCRKAIGKFGQKVGHKPDARSETHNSREPGSWHETGPAGVGQESRRDCARNSEKIGGSL